MKTTRLHALNTPASLIYLLLAMTLNACSDFVDIELSRSKISADLVFSTDNTASSAVLGMYHEMIQSPLITGSRNSLARLAGLSGDELKEYKSNDGIIQFEENTLTADNTNVANVWNAIYATIYRANAVVEGLQTSVGLTSALKDRLLGEALFIRAFSHFYAVNAFGEVPLILTTDYRVNSIAKRMPLQAVYDQIVADLQQAQALMPENYPAAERVRPTRSAATALLARVHLFAKNWVAAETQATTVIDHPLYQMEPELTSVFSKASREAIWQLPQVNGLPNTDEAIYFDVGSTSIIYLILRNEVVQDFEPNDKRNTEWVGIYQASDQTIFYPRKYRISATGKVTEFSTVLRLAEQYLIRAEARAQMNDLTGAIQDLDVIRQRAGLPLIHDTDPGISKADLLLKIEHERRIEFFSEWGHRWFDLKRNERALAVLNPIKPGFSAEDQLYPIPQSELDRNPYLGSQNAGY